MFRDLKLGLRTAFRSPSYSVVAIVTMALAIGANTLLFTLANPLVVRPLPLKDPDSIGWVYQRNGPQGVSRGGSSIQDLLDLRAQTTQFTSLAGREVGAATLVGLGDPRRVNLFRVTTNLPTVWGLTPVQGRLFLEGEDAPGADLVGVLSHRFWRDAFQSDPGVLNRTFLLDGRTLTIVGVMTPTIEFGNITDFDLWVPLPLDPSKPRDARTVSVMGTLAPGATITTAGAEMAALAARLAESHPATHTDWELQVIDTRTAITSADTWVILGLMSVIVVFVLLIACASLANLARARLVGRAQDLTVRRALGASRLQLVRPLVAESVLLGLVGGAVGLGIAQGGIRLINVVAAEPFFKALSIDQYVLGFNVALSIVTPLLFSVWPAMPQSRDASGELRGSRIRGSRRGRKHGRLLIVSQVAMALSLLVVSALAVQSMWNLRNTPIGMDIEHVLTFSVDLPADRYPTDDMRRDVTRRLTAALAEAPAVRAAALASHLPTFTREVQYRLSGTPNDGVREGEQPWAAWYAVTPEFFDTVAIPLVAGRRLETGDVDGRQPVIVLNQSAATRYFNDPAAAVGRTVTLSGGGVDRVVTIVGVVGDTQHSNLAGDNPQVYQPLDQAPAASMTVALSAADPLSRVSDVRLALRRVDPALAITEPRTMAQILDAETSSSRILNGIFVAFAGLALVLAAAGLYGVISFTVGQRRQEFGVRLALGAEPRSIRSLVLREGLTLSIVGVVVGLVIAYVLANASSSVLFGVTPEDPTTYGGVTMTVISVAALAVLIPAIRAMRVDPVTALRAD